MWLLICAGIELIQMSKRGPRSAEILIMQNVLLDDDYQLPKIFEWWEMI